MNLIVVSSLTCNEGLFFRYITMMAKTEMNHDILIEAEKEKIKDFFIQKKVSQATRDYIEALKKQAKIKTYF